jgi:branched-chain amino acid transport system permease protein
VRELGWSGAVELFRNGLALGSLYALIALGYTMVYGILKLLNFAHGDVYMVGAFIGFGVLNALGGSPSPTIAILPLIVLMFLVAMLGAGALGVVIERFAYRPLRSSPRLTVLITALGVSFFLQNSMLLLFGAQFRSYQSFQLGSDNPAAFEPGPLVEPLFTIAGVNFQRIQIAVLATSVALMVALTLLVAKTTLGKAMRATAFDHEAAAMMGIDVNRVIAATFFIGSVLAGAAGVMFGLMFSQINHFMGFYAGLKGFTAAVVGGIGSIPGAMLGGLLVGLVESYAQGYLGGQWSDIAVFAILIVVLLVRPTGLLGARAIQKV